jgi:hypothetical protein
MAYLREKNVLVTGEQISIEPVTRVKCKIKNCVVFQKGNARLCFECGNFPCTNLKRLDKRYRIKYNMIMIENLENIKGLSIEKFLGKWRPCVRREKVHIPIRPPLGWTGVEICRFGSTRFVPLRELCGLPEGGCPDSNILVRRVLGKNPVGPVAFPLRLQGTISSLRTTKNTLKQQVVL